MICLLFEAELYPIKRSSVIAVHRAHGLRVDSKFSGSQPDILVSKIAAPDSRQPPAMIRTAVDTAASRLPRLPMAPAPSEECRRGRRPRSGQAECVILSPPAAGDVIEAHSRLPRPQLAEFTQLAIAEAVPPDGRSYIHGYRLDVNSPGSSRFQQHDEVLRTRRPLITTFGGSVEARLAPEACRLSRRSRMSC